MHCMREFSTPVGHISSFRIQIKRQVKEIYIKDFNLKETYKTRKETWLKCKLKYISFYISNIYCALTKPIWIKICIIIILYMQFPSVINWERDYNLLTWCITIGHFLIQVCNIWRNCQLYVTCKLLNCGKLKTAEFKH